MKRCAALRALLRTSLPLLAVCAPGLADDLPFLEVLAYFEYDRSQPANVRSNPIESAEGVAVSEYSFASPDDGRVAGLLVKPTAPGKYPLILYGHWMMKDSPFRNHAEFREEAVIMARAGAVCFLLDSPLVRGEVPEIEDPTQGQGPKAKLQMAREWRKAVDIMIDSGDADAERIAYVGHSFGAGVGAMLTAVEPRVQSFVLMAANYTPRETITKLSGRDTATISRYFENFPWADTIQFTERSAPSAVFLQFGRRDELISTQVARKGAAHFQQPKRMAFYNAGHELNAEARIDRARWLAGRLKLRSIDEGALNAIPALD